MGEVSTTVKGLLPKIQSLLNNRMFSDVEFIFDDDDLGKSSKLYAHRLILALRSEYFASALYENEKPYQQFKIPSNKTTFYSLLRFVYTDEVHLESVEEVEDLLSLARQFGVKELESRCVTYLLEEAITIENIFSKYEYAISRNVEPLLNSCREFVCHPAETVFNSPGFEHASAEVVEDILKQENLTIPTELVILNAVLNWGKAKCKKAKMSSDDSSLKKCIYPFLKHIRFLTLTKTEFLSILKDNIFNPDEIVELTCKIVQPEGDNNIPEYICSLSRKRGILHTGTATAINKQQMIPLQSTATSESRKSTLPGHSHMFSNHYESYSPQLTSHKDSVKTDNGDGAMRNNFSFSRNMSTHSSNDTGGTNSPYSNYISEAFENKPDMNNFSFSRNTSTHSSNVTGATNSPYSNYISQPCEDKPDMAEKYKSIFPLNDSKKTNEYKPDCILNYDNQVVMMNSSFHSRLSDNTVVTNHSYSHDLCTSEVSEKNVDVTSKTKSTFADPRKTKEYESLIQKINELQNASKPKVLTTPNTVDRNSIEMYKKSVSLDNSSSMPATNYNSKEYKSPDSNNKFSFEVTKPALFPKHNVPATQRHTARFQPVPNLFSQGLSPRAYIFKLSECETSMDSSFPRDVKCSVSFQMKSGTMKLCGFELYIKNTVGQKSEMIDVDVDLSGLSVTFNKLYRKELKNNLLEIRFPDSLLIEKKGELDVSIDKLVPHRCRVSSIGKFEFNNGSNWMCELTISSNQRFKNDTLCLINRLFYIAC